MKNSILSGAALVLLGAAISSYAAEQLAEAPAPEPGFQVVDLTNYYTEGAGGWPAGSCWSAVPWGHQSYDGVPFECGGILEVTGMDAARRVGQVFPGRYTGIRVGSAGAWIHLVQGVGWKEADGVPIARIRLHYQDGRTSDLLVRYGVQVRNWWQEPSEPDARLADPNSKVIWSAPNPEPVGRPTALRLYKSSFASPRPEAVLASLDVESLFSHATPVVVAITVGKAGAGVKREKVGSVVVPGLVTEPLVVRAADTGQPIPGARLEVVLSDGEHTYPFGEQMTDAKGRTVLDFCRQQVSALDLNVSAPGYAPVQFSRNILDLPPELELTLQRGTQ